MEPVTRTRQSEETFYPLTRPIFLSAQALLLADANCADQLTDLHNKPDA